jgi:hypothetical protein
MSGEEKPMTARAQLAQGWELTEQSMAVVGLTIPYCIEFQIDGAKQIRATRVVELDELAKAIDAIDEDIGRLFQGAPPLVSYDSNIERLRQERTALIELPERANRSGCPGSTTVIEALFPDIPVRKKTASEKAEVEQWLAIRKEAGLKIDPETAEVDWSYGEDLDPYGVCDEWELPEEFHSWGRQHWARGRGGDVWVHFGDLPDSVREQIWAKHRPQIAFPAGLEGMPGTAIEEEDVPF